MNQAFNDAVVLSNNYQNINFSSSIPYGFVSAGDTNAIQTKRVIPLAISPGYPGEFCFGTETIGLISTTYLYYCTSGNGVVGTWVRRSLNTW